MLRQGQLFINDRAATLTPDGMGDTEDKRGDSERAYRFTETLPNGVTHPRSQDARTMGRLDNTPEVTVPPGDVLSVLGDNRDTFRPTAASPCATVALASCRIDDLVGRADAVGSSWGFWHCATSRCGTWLLWL